MLMSIELDREIMKEQFEAEPVSECIDFALAILETIDIKEHLNAVDEGVMDYIRNKLSQLYQSFIREDAEEVEPVDEANGPKPE